MAIPYEESRKIVVRLKLTGGEDAVIDLFNTEVLPEMRSDAIAAFSGIVNNLILIEDLDVRQIDPPPPNRWEVYPKMFVTGTTTAENQDPDDVWNALNDQWKSKMREKIQGGGGIVISWHRHAYNQELEEQDR